MVGNIRIGAFAIEGFAGAVGYAPPPNGGTTLQGDVIFKASNRFGLPAGSQGAPYALYPASNNDEHLSDLAGLFTHELGHALGLGRSEVATAVMRGYVNASVNANARVSACAWARRRRLRAHHPPAQGRRHCQHPGAVQPRRGRARAGHLGTRAWRGWAACVDDCGAAGLHANATDANKVTSLTPATAICGVTARGHSRYVAGAHHGRKRKPRHARHRDRRNR